jgi:putative transposase
VSPTKRHQSLEYYKSRPTPSQRSRRPADQTLELEVRDCIHSAKALRKAVRSVFGEVPVQRCLWHKERNVLGHLPERDRPPIKARMRRAWRETDYPRALEQLQRLADELERTHPGAAGSLREGMDETLTVIKLGIKGKLRRTLESTNPRESMIDTVRTTQRNVKNWSSGEMGLRWTAAGMLEAEKQFRKVIGYTDLPRLAIATERRLHLHQPNSAPTQEAALAVTM